MNHILDIIHHQKSQYGNSHQDDDDHDHNTSLHLRWMFHGFDTINRSLFILQIQGVCHREILMHDVFDIHGSLHAKPFVIETDEKPKSRILDMFIQSLFLCHCTAIE